MNRKPITRVACVCASFLLAGVFGLLASNGAQADTVPLPGVIGSVLDVEIDGTFDSVQEAMVMGLAFVAGRQDQRTITEFDLSVVPAGATIVNATFLARIFGSTGSENPDIEVYGYDGDGELTLADGYETDELQTTFVGMLGEWVELDVTDLVGSLFGVDQWVGLHFRNVTPGTSIEFDPNAGSNPRLIVEYGPPTPAAQTTWGRIRALHRGE